MSDPAFLQFAEQLHVAANEMQTHAETWRGLVDIPTLHDAQQRTVDALKLAERHARLLAAVSAWANAQVPPVTFYAPGQLEEREQYHKGISYSQAHVRALLAQSEEK